MPMMAMSFPVRRFVTLMVGAPFCLAPTAIISWFGNEQSNGTMLCSCCGFESTGIFCVHQIAIAIKIFGEDHIFKGFTHRDIAIRYRNDFMHLAYKNTTPERLQACFHALAMNDIRGPKIGIPVPPVHIIPIEAPVLHCSGSTKQLRQNDKEEFTVAS